MSNSPPRGLLMVISAPSGTGKTTVVERLVQACPGLARSRSYTSRPARAGERDGVDYNFIDRQAFEAMAAQGGFLEWADVFGNLYGTGRADTEALLTHGHDVVLVIDVQGARQVRTRVPEAVGVFVLPPSFEALESRLRGRCQDDERAIRRRLATARAEVSAVDEYDYVVINDELTRCVGELCAIVTAERARRVRRLPGIEPIVNTFRGTA
ncbi:MAG TPA: guanylate kinase [Vicinamibacterales bacterium]|nr:guanylate kinase [Vicinamibacterales bacterium]